MNQFNENEMAVITASLLVAVRAKLKSASACAGDSAKQAHHLGFANDAIKLYRQIANGTDEPDMMNGYMDDVLKKFEDIIEGGKRE